MSDLSNENKKLMQDIFAKLSIGDDTLFVDSMAEEIKWIWMGSGQWSKSFIGKTQVVGDLWSAVRKTLKPPYKSFATNFIADGEYVVVEAVGENTTPDGKLYNNKYCWVCRISNSKICEVREYMDTDLVTRTFAQ